MSTNAESPQYYRDSPGEDRQRGAHHSHPGDEQQQGGPHQGGRPADHRPQPRRQTPASAAPAHWRHGPPQVKHRQLQQDTRSVNPVGLRSWFDVIAPSPHTVFRRDLLLLSM